MSPLKWVSILLVSGSWLYSQSPASYRDPQGRFGITAPSGWTVTRLNSDAIGFSSGMANATLLVLPGNSEQAVLDNIGRQSAGQWRNFVEARRGAVQLAGRGGSFITYSGTNPRGVEAYLELMAVSDGNSVYLLMLTAPKAEFSRQQAGFDALQRSLAISAGQSNAAPAPENRTPKVPVTGNGPLQPPSSTTRPTPAAATAPPSTAGEKPAFYRMKNASVIDEHGFERPMPAVTLLVPVDWGFQGSAKYQATFGGCHENTVQVGFQASSPDQRLALEMFPNYVWQWVEDPGMVQALQMSARQMAQFGGRPCEVMPGMSAADYLRRRIIPNARPKAQIAAVEPMPEVLQQVQEQAKQLEQAAARAGMRMQIRADAARVRLQYSLNGQPVEEWFTAITYVAGVPGPSYNIRTGQMGQTLYEGNGAYMVMAMRAPQGELASHEKFFNMMRSTVHAEPQWMARVQQAILNMQAADSKGAMDRSRIIAQNGQEINNMITKGYEERSKAQEQSVYKFDQYIRGVGTYRNPSTGETFELPYYYNHAWVNGTGTEYVVSNSGFYNPNTSIGGNWTEVVPVK